MKSREYRISKEVASEIKKTKAAKDNTKTILQDHIQLQKS